MVFAHVNTPRPTASVAGAGRGPRGWPPWCAV